MMMPKTPPLLLPTGLGFQFASHDTLEPLITNTSSQGTQPSRSSHLPSVAEEIKEDDHADYPISSPFGSPSELPAFKYYQQERPFTSPESSPQANNRFTNNGPLDETDSTLPAKR
jgi:hypothetical protein